ncbi:hypothetical protein F5Y03DRAFT_408433 [Xylaria venustula]|nr:hypothetical protein F5Y03DRAFT_408433 [Xylaria venustula]
MGPFALSVPGYRLGVHPHKHQQQPQQQHEPARPSSASGESLDTEAGPPPSSSSRLPSETINPLSHSPSTLRQLAAAGLTPEDELPSRIHKGFPHRPLPVRTLRGRREALSPGRSLYDSDGGGGGGGGGSETDTTTATAASQPSRKKGADDDVGDGTRHDLARIRHLGTLAAVMHRCLRDGDMGRAKRAFGLLLRTRDVDVRLDNLWAVGSEILMREGEEEEKAVVVAVGEASSELHKKAGKEKGESKRKGEGKADPYEISCSDTDSGSDMAEREEDDVEEPVDDAGDGGDDDDEREGDGDGRRHHPPPPPRRWGTAANVSRVKVYLETLAQHHPHDPKRPHLTSAVDFWPALFGIELYNLDAEFQEAQHRIYLESGFPPSPSSSRSSSPPAEHDDPDRMDLDGDDYTMDFSEGGQGPRRRRRKHGIGQEEEEDEEDESAANRHNALDALRAATQRGALEITTRMDGILENPPYSTHAELLRQRGHAALFMADLYLPSRLVERHRRKQSRLVAGEGGEGGENGGLREAERRLRMHVKTPEERVALARRAEEQDRARALFRRAVAAKGGDGLVEGWVLRFLEEEEEEEEE